MISSFVPEKEKKKEPVKEMERRETRGVRVNYKEVAGIKERKSKK